MFDSIFMQSRLVKPLVSIISVNYNSLDVTIEMIESVYRNAYQNIEIIVVDNGSEVSPKIQLQEQFPQVIVIEAGKNLGFAGGNNLGIAASRGAYIFCLNNDAELTNGVIEKLLQLFEETPNLGIASPKICFFPGAGNKPEPDIIQYAGSTPVHNLTARNETIGRFEKDEGQYSKAKPTAYVHGAAMMIKKEVIEQVGLMAEEFFLYYEELDWCEQIKRKGYEIYIEPNGTVYHKESYSVGKISTLRTYYLTRNRILFMRRNRQDLQVAVFCLFLIFFTIPKNTLQFFVKRDFKNLGAFWKAIFWNVKDRFQQRRKIKSNLSRIDIHGLALSSNDSILFEKR